MRRSGGRLAGGGGRRGRSGRHGARGSRGRGSQGRPPGVCSAAGWAPAALAEDGALSRRSGREARRWLRLSLFAGLVRQGDRDVSGRLAVWICDFGENRARECGSGTASRLMVMATGERVLITRDLVSRGLGQWPEGCTLRADGRGPSRQRGGRVFQENVRLALLHFAERAEG